MTTREVKAEVVDIKGLLARDEDFVRSAVEALVQAALEAEMTEALGAAKGERSETRITYRSGYYTRSLITRVGTLELRVPRLGQRGSAFVEERPRSAAGGHFRRDPAPPSRDRSLLKKGGKVVWYHGGSDLLISPFISYLVL